MPVLIIRALCAVLLALFAVGGWAQSLHTQPFRISKIEVNGVKRLSRGTVLTYLPVSVGDRMTTKRAARSIKSLYQTGLFGNVSLDRSGGRLIVDVEERPKIASFKLEGNKALSSDKLKKALKKQGLAQGRLFKRKLLDQLRQQLNQHYYANGYYSLKIDTKVKQLENNRVAIDVKVDEGPIAAIKKINFIGNNKFADDKLRSVFKLEQKKSWLGQLGAHPVTFWKSHDHYSRQKLLGDLESLTSFYKDRGYLRFNVSSVQVSIAPDKKDVYLTVNVDEGHKYKISDIKIAGQTIEPKASLQRLVGVQEGQTYSRKQVQDTAKQMTTSLANFGYAFADVKPLSKVDKEKHTVALTFLVKPGDRTYVRQIGFTGNKKTTDQTLRRELRQFEGAPYSRRAVQRSRVRLQRLPYIKTVKLNKNKKVGAKDQVDLDYKLKERAAGKLQVGLGYSGNEGFLINGSVSNNNFRGTGNKVKFKAQTNSYQRSIRGSWTDPYFTRNGVSQTVSAFYRQTDSLVRRGSDFNLDSFGASDIFRFPISEYSNIKFGFGAQQNNIDVGNGTSSRVRRFVRENGTDATTYSLKAGWQRDTRNRTVFATKGSNLQIDASVKGPGSDLEYYSSSLKAKKFFAIGSALPVVPDGLVFSVKGRVAQTDIWGKGTDVPPYANYFAGGPKSIRGFESGGAGPQNEYGDAYGGQFLTTLQSNLILPTFLPSNGKSTRFMLFYDMGAAYKDVGHYDSGKMRKSAGVAFEWFTPFFGLLRVSYAGYVDGQERDDKKRFQFSFGVGF
ncbi:outer membrane protein assembly factor BamA [Salinisphaera sp. USBA-960]|uniref:outer membrane protein assembly factor BamA n=1 Tax=Salinisphaera orenii TaxID=856731 RepID=UPI000DBEA947|nr:outer membrane protein assembly factor BamA [Salifodinibacter halophilus]NNC26210.1 outer membrane protein assembly factor BamA [Salifodinibacter halophilus]